MARSLSSRTITAALPRVFAAFTSNNTVIAPTFAASVTSTPATSCFGISTFCSFNHQGHRHWALHLFSSLLRHRKRVLKVSLKSFTQHIAALHHTVLRSSRHGDLPSSQGNEFPVTSRLVSSTLHTHLPASPLWPWRSNTELCHHVKEKTCLMTLPKTNGMLRTFPSTQGCSEMILTCIDRRL